MRTRPRYAIFALLVLLAASSTASAQAVESSFVGPSGALVTTGDSGVLTVTVEHWDTDNNRFEEVETISRTVVQGEEYLLPLSAVEDAGAYRATLTLAGDTVVKSFRYKVQEVTRIRDSEYSADAGGGSLFLAPSSATVVDARFLLVRDGRVLETRTENDRIVSTSLNLEKNWRNLLDDETAYSSAVLFTSQDRTRMLIDTFTARQDASLDVTSLDENRANLEVTGESQVSLDARLTVRLSRDGEEVGTFTRDVPPLLDEESEDFDVFWPRVLEPGTYTVEASLSSDGAVLDRQSLSLETRQDAEITDVFGDSRGGTISVEGASEIPLDAEVTISVSRDGEVLETLTENAPVVLDGNEETVEVAWTEPLPAGEYVVRGELSADGELLDRAGNVFTVEPRAPTPTPTETQAPGPGALAALGIIAAAYLVRRK